MSSVLNRRDFVNLSKGFLQSFFEVGSHPSIRYSYTSEEIARKICSLAVEVLDHEMRFNISDAIDEAIIEWMREQTPIGSRQVA